MIYIYIIYIHLSFVQPYDSWWPPFTPRLENRQVVFQPQNVMTMARAGQPLSEVASQADVFIRTQTCISNVRVDDSG